MNVLAFDTCFGAVSAAVRWKSDRGEWLLRETYEPMAIGHAERLLPVIDNVMAGAGLTFSRLDRIAITLGPGGFTGLRLGIAAARALALSTGLPVVGLSSLMVMAARAELLLAGRDAFRHLAVAVDARRDAVYFQLFGETAADPITEPRLLTAIEAAAALPAGDVLVVGSAGAPVTALAARPDVVARLPALQPHARQLAMMAPALAPLTRVTPLYLRAADAKPSTASLVSRRPGP